jgi:hypothetical protein
METKKNSAKDTKVTILSLTVIVVQSVIIILGFLNRWDWIAWEFGAMLIIPAVIIGYYGILAIIKADKLMSEERKVDDEE